MVVYVKRGASDLSLPLVVPCFMKIQFGLTFLVPACPGCCGKAAI